MEQGKKIRRDIFLILTTVLGGLSFTNDAYAGTYGITSGRLESILAAVAGIISIVIGRSALRSINHNSSVKKKSIISLALGLICLMTSSIHLVRSYTASFGTGSGKAGAIVALVIGLIGMILGGLSLSRSMRRNSKI